jgi:uncharacterized protein (TIRG00374 family)
MIKKPYLWWVIGIGIMVLILSKIDLTNTFLIFSTAKVPYLPLIFLLTVPVILVKVFRWRYLLKMQQIDYGFTASLLTLLAGMYVAIITPGRIGELARVYYLKKEKRISMGKSLSSLFMDRILDVLILLFFACSGLLIFSVSKKLTVLIVALTVLLVLGGVLSLRREYTQRLLGFLSRLSFFKKLAHQAGITFGDFYGGIEKMRDWRLAFPLLLSLSAYLIGFFQCYLISAALNIPISFPYLVFCVAVVSLISGIPISIAGIGTRDATLIGLFAVLGLEPESAVSFSLMYLFVFNISVAFIGLLAWWKKSSVHALKKQNEREPIG